MIVAELRVILDHVPDDLPVLIPIPGGVGHVGRVRRNTNLVVRSLDRPASLSLEPPYYWEGRPRWDEPEPAFALAGPFRRQELLIERLDGIRP